MLLPALSITQSMYEPGSLNVEAIIVPHVAPLSEDFSAEMLLLLLTPSAHKFPLESLNREWTGEPAFTVLGLLRPYVAARSMAANYNTAPLVESITWSGGERIVFHAEIVFQLTRGSFPVPARSSGKTM